jgi:nucleotide-binding universal stress UspA family protein
MYKNILVAIDGSDTANQGLGEAIKLAKSLGSCIRLIHVANESDAVPADLPGVDIRGVVRQVRDSGEALLARTRDQVRAAAVAVETQLVEAWSGEPGDEVIQHARQWPADLIVCGTHGRRGFRRIIMGSDAELIVRHSPVPVLLVRAQPTHESR